MDLTQDDVLHILKLIDESPVGRFSLQMGDFKLEFAKGTGGQLGAEPLALPPSAPLTAATQVAQAAPAAKEESVSRLPATPAQSLVPIKAPLLGIFYRRPQPGAPLYVEERSLVEEDTTVALIEVMKLFNPVKAGVRGRIARICVDNGSLVEYGQDLFQVEPE